MSKLLTLIPQFWKAIIAFVAPAAVVIGASVLKGSDGGSTITQAEWITAAVAAIITSAGVGAKGNAPKPPQ
jgi:hypothetical protein